MFFPIIASCFCLLNSHNLYFFQFLVLLLYFIYHCDCWLFYNFLFTFFQRESIKPFLIRGVSSTCKFLLIQFFLSYSPIYVLSNGETKSCSLFFYRWKNPSLFSWTSIFKPTNYGWASIDINMVTSLEEMRSSGLRTNIFYMRSEAPLLKNSSPLGYSAWAIFL